MKHLKRMVLGACIVSTALLLAPQHASAAFYWQSGEDWQVGDVPEGATFTETNNGYSGREGQDRGKVDEPLENSGFFNDVAPTSSISSSAIGRVAGGSDSGQWTADLNDVYIIDRIVLHTAAANNWHGRYGATVSYSVDGLNWTVAGTVPTVTPTGTAQAWAEDVDFNGAEARYLRLGYSNSSGNFHHRMDSMDVYIVPEPASIMLVGAAATLLLARRRRTLLK
ncbi:discoidin domain-containing protein [Phycisphaerales bacterium AB-hyl4]|uniref:Discoidin domain-containing protein n=1 Tax=Natronomicrosphaera hydrolytica TaxID=3242702 RepID=A0ABV4UAX4_9BACT